MRVLCTICARGGSKGVKNKNLLKINNKSLIEITYDISKKVNYISKISFSSDSEKLLSHAKKLNIEHILKRPKYLALSNTPKILAIKHLLNYSEIFYNTKFDYIVDLDVTSPLRTKKDIENCILKLKKKNFDAVVTVNKSRRNPYYNIIEKKKNKFDVSIKRKRPFFSRQSAPVVFDLNPSIYVWKRDYLLKTNNLFAGNIGIHILKNIQANDIDSYEDYRYIKYVMEKKK